MLIELIAAEGFKAGRKIEKTIMPKDLGRFHPGSGPIKRFRPMVFLFLIAPLALSLTLVPRESMAAAASRAAVKALGILRLSSDNVLATFVAVARKDNDSQVRFAALLAIGDLGKNGVSAKADIEWIRDNDTDMGNRGAAKDALHAVLNNKPRLQHERRRKSDKTRG